MCVDSSRVQFSLNSVNHSKKFATSYSIKKMLKTIFKKYKVKDASSCESLESLESLDNIRNSQVEDYSTEIEDNAANERLLENYEQLSDYESEDDDQDKFLIPVNCVQTPSGTFFWTATQQPADKDLIQPLNCYTQYQIAEFQRCDRWAQA